MYYDGSQEFELEEDKLYVLFFFFNVRPTLYRPDSCLKTQPYRTLSYVSQYYNAYVQP